MSSYDELYAMADRCRIELYQPAEAIALYKQALELGGAHDRAIKQMIGVCYTLLHDYDPATEWLLEAMDNASDYERGNIERDMAAAYEGLGEHEMADISLATALDLLPAYEYPAEHAATLGFLARTQLNRGELRKAIETFADADARLHRADNRHTELYNKLHYASALSRAGRHIAARHVALDSLKLALKYGAVAHRMRALALLVGGYRGETFARRHFIKP